MSDSESDLYVDSEEELQELRKIRQVMECDDSSILSGPDRTRKKLEKDEVGDFINKALHEVEVALSLNKQINVKFLYLEKIVERDTADCIDQLKRIRGQFNSDADRSESFRYINCGRPYFKDKENFSAPDNDDTVIMEKNHMYDFSNITSVPGWTMRDKSQLWNQIEKMTKALKRRELLSTIAQMRRDCKSKSFKDRMVVEKQITKIKKDVGKLNSKKLDELALPIDKEYDWEELTHSLDRRHSASEYQSLWKLYLHPSINKSNWSKEEHQLLQKIAYEYELHDWEKIAKAMGNNRTGYQCFVYFRTNMNNTFTGKKWSDEEVDYLLRLIEYYKEDNYIPWVKVAALIENRTKIQIYNKYIRLLEQRKGRFLPEEDTVILTCVDEFGKDFKKIAQYLPGRSISQIRVRYQSLSKTRVSAVWTVEEDKKLLQLLSNQDSATNYASITKHFPGKDRIHIRARYVTLIKWMRRNPNVDISNAPRRGARRLGHGKASENLNVAVECLKSRIQTEANKRKRCDRIGSQSTEEAIEDVCVASFINDDWSNDQTWDDCYDSDQLSNENNPGDKFEGIYGGYLQKLLLLLRAKLDKVLFEKLHSTLLHKLTLPSDQICVVKIKSYSKKNKIKSIELDVPPDVWGSNAFKAFQYALPPHYSTITGCRKLMTYVAGRLHFDDLHVSLLNCRITGRRNIVFREQFDVLLERFNSLFMWPLVLSNANREDVVGERMIITEIMSGDEADDAVCATGVRSITAVDITSETEDLNHE